MRLIVHQVPTLAVIGALAIICGLVGLHIQDALETTQKHSELARSRTSGSQSVPPDRNTDAQGCLVLPDGLRICDLRGLDPASVSRASVPNRRYPNKTRAERPPRNEATRVVDWIVRIAGVARNFEVIEADFKFGSIAFAAVREGRRMIVYDARMFDWRAGTVRWRHVAIMAHEIAHHLNGDTTGSHGAVHSHEKELAADYFAGFVVARLGGTLAQALGVTELLSKEESASHPSRKARRKTIAAGWHAGRNSDVLWHEEALREANR